MTPWVSLDDLRMRVYKAGYDIHVARISGGVLAYTNVAERTVYVQRGLAGRQLRSTLAHELVHARLEHADHRRQTFGAWRGHIEPWLEDAVDVIAASTLFDLDDLERAMAAEGPHPTYAAVARRLGVDVAMLRTWNAARKHATGGRCDRVRAQDRAS